MQTPKVDWSDWSLGPGRHPIQGAAQAGLAAFTVTMVGAVDGWMPAVWPLIAGAVLGCAAAISAGWQGMPGAVVAYRAVCLVSAGVWASSTLAWSVPWSRWPLVTLATGTAAAATVGTGLARMERREKPVEAPTPMRLGRDRLLVEWETRLRRISRREVILTGVERWEPPTGHTLHGQLPADGTTVMDLKAFEGPLAAAANLPPGCNVEVLPGARRRLFSVRVATENAMAETHHLPDDVTPLSINGLLPIGIHADRSLAAINLRYACGVLVGQTDSGKSNTLNGITHQLVRCTDALVWAIDLTGGGRFPRPWVRAWREGRADRPPIDWVATTADEALALTAAAVDIINGRTAAYQELMFAANDDKLPVSPQVPQIVILADEYADLPGAVKERLETISNTGRGAGVRVVSSVLRAIGADISRAMIVQARERIAMRVTDEAELQYLFDAMWSRGRVDPASVPYQGSGLIATGATPIAPFKAWRLEPARIDAAAAAVAGLRPALDAISVQLAGEGYSRRWDRTLPTMFPTSGHPPLRGDQPTAAPVAATPRTEQEETVEKPSLDESADRLRQAVANARAAREADDAAQAEPEVSEADWSVVEGWLTESSDDGQKKLPARARMRQLVEEHRRDGIGPRAVYQQLQAEGYSTRESTVITWMRADAQAGILAQPGGERTPYVPGPQFRLDQP